MRQRLDFYYPTTLLQDMDHPVGMLLFREASWEVPVLNLSIAQHIEMGLQIVIDVQQAHVDEG